MATRSFLRHSLRLPAALVGVVLIVWPAPGWTPVARGVEPSVDARGLEAYEREACAYSQQLFHEAGIRDLDGWLADMSACDFAFLRHVYQTGERRPFAHFWRSGTARLEPRPIPPFTPRDWRNSATPIFL